jgi:KaiC/GvpD/RAD55 family RecA-like ATPase
MHMSIDLLNRIVATYEAGQPAYDSLAVIYPSDTGKPVFAITQAGEWLTDGDIVDFLAFAHKANGMTPRAFEAALEDMLAQVREIIEENGKC